MRFDPRLDLLDVVSISKAFIEWLMEVGDMEAVLIFDGDLICRAANSKADRLLGYGDGQVGLSLEALWAHPTISFEEHRQWFLSADVFRTMAGGQLVPIRCFDGTIKNVRLSFGPIRYLKSSLGIYRAAELREEEAEAGADGRS